MKILMKNPNVSQHCPSTIGRPRVSLISGLHSAARLGAASLLLTLLMGGPRLLAASFVNEDVTVNRMSGNVGGSVGIGTLAPGARLDMRGTDTAATLVKILQVENPVAVQIGQSHPPTFNILEIDRQGAFPMPGQSALSRLLTFNGAGHLGLGTKTPSCPLEIVMVPAMNRPGFNLTSLQKRSVFVVPRLGNSGFNAHRSTATWESSIPMGRASAR